MAWVYGRVWDGDGVSAARGGLASSCTSSSSLPAIQALPPPAQSGGLKGGFAAVWDEGVTVTRATSQPASRICDTFSLFYAA